MLPMSRSKSSRLNRLFAATVSVALLFGLGALPSAAIAAPPAAKIWGPGTATAAAVTVTPSTTTLAALDLSAPPALAAQPRTPIYEKWWFWTAIAAAAVTTVVIVAATSGPTQPKTDLGNMVAF